MKDLLLLQHRGEMFTAIRIGRFSAAIQLFLLVCVSLIFLNVTIRITVFLSILIRAVKKFSDSFLTCSVLCMCSPGLLIHEGVRFLGHPLAEGS